MPPLEGLRRNTFSLGDVLDERPPSRAVLGREFFDEITTSPVPVDLRALRLLKGSPLALDIYCWLTYRLSYLRRPCLIPWEALQLQFGADYCRPRDFRRRFVAQLAAVLGVYPSALRARD